VLSISSSDIPSAPYDLGPGEIVVDAARTTLTMDGGSVGSWGAAYLTSMRLHWAPANPGSGIFTAPGDVYFAEIREVKHTWWYANYWIHHGVRVTTDDHQLVLGRMPGEQAKRWASYVQNHAPNLAAPGTAKSRMTFRKIVSRRSAPLTALFALLLFARALSWLSDDFSPGDLLLACVAVVALLLAWVLYQTRE
jgi:hypothetical protein